MPDTDVARFPQIPQTRRSVHTQIAQIFHVLEYATNQLYNEIEKICEIRVEHTTTGLRDPREMPYDGDSPT